MNAAQHAERALLGSLLIEPQRFADIDGWLLPSDFGTNRHYYAYQAMLAARERGQVDLPAVSAAAAADQTTRINGVDAAYLGGLMQSSPVPDRAAVYARLVVESAIHRKVAYHAARLDAVTRMDAAGDVVGAGILTRTEELAESLDEAAARWPEPAAHDESVEDVQPPRVTAPVPAELTLIASLLYQPSQLPTIARWLEPTDVAHPGLRATYVAMLTLAARGEPIDEITVLWEANRARGLDPRRFGADDIVRLAGQGVPGFATDAAQQVLLASLRRRAALAATTIGWTAMRPELDPPNLVAHARHHLDPAQKTGQRWQSSLTPTA